MVPVAVVQMTPEGGTLMAHRSAWVGVLDVMQRSDAYKPLAKIIRVDVPPEDEGVDPVVTIRLVRYVADAVLAVALRNETAGRIVE